MELELNFSFQVAHNIDKDTPITYKGRKGWN